MLTQLAELGRRAKEHKVLTNVINLLDLELLRAAFRSLKRDAAAGIDGVTYQMYEQNAEANLGSLYERLKSGKYKAPPVRRVYIRKDNGKQRPLGIGTLEDRIVQKAVAWMLTAVFEEDFQECSHGFRPKRSCHTALARLDQALMKNRGRLVVEADVRGFFDHINHEWMRKFLRHRISDKGLLRLVGKWLKAGVMENGIITHLEEGTPQGGPISPVLANIYLHYVLDLWFERRFRRQCQGVAILTRYADDFIAVFERQADAYRFRQELDLRFAQFRLEIVPEKTRVMVFGIYAPEYLARYGEKPLTFDFLGFTHYCGRSRTGSRFIGRKPSRKRRERFIKRIRTWLLFNRHLPVQMQRDYLSAALRGYYQYYGLRLCTNALNGVRFRIFGIWRYALMRRSQKAKRSCSWEDLQKCPWFRLPRATVIHPMV